MELLFRPDGLLVLAVFAAALAFAWNFRLKRASRKLLLAGSAAFFCGVLSVALVATQVAVFLATRMAQSLDVPGRIAVSRKLVIAGVPYDMRLYYVLLLSLVVLIPSVRCIRSASRVAIGARDGWKKVVRANLLLLVVSVPLIPLQPFALLIALPAFLSLEAAFAARDDLTTYMKLRAKRQVRPEEATTTTYLVSAL